ncbi:TIGR04282 family arsenosugar biosynthesis glycosyltransferase [Psychroflexus sp. CAK57W]|uniref:TIGR04282 family arsenosugar biosynthesis glycosyltransferase n=1 Tax=Psychroflexus curvus TaxID=2873595 RepID=UPI001CCC3615|nr:TIGR04282 family arsenosugar biosynthesis glycosyltransferase [Psychroflexus curvus]MBZ9627177.1 TIGR04282 family arsenosugar biosynthesis glycosyltransferase [Psychroflexus curvus]MBZ9787171.1 TIGR04282 family arsenosugar biosynthesis glycosyltransferase [Psychroflexus curvus]
MKKLVIVFAKNPEPGKCKTRLAKSIGDEKALEVYKELIKHTAKTIGNANTSRAVFYSEEIQTQDLWNDTLFQKEIQSNGHLGQKMQAAFEWGFEQGYSKICIVGSDLFELETSDIDKAFQELEQTDIVFGPANDGGYYLMGMTRFYKNAFLEKAWSTESVLEKTIEDLKGLKLAFLKTKTDIDTLEDLAKHPEFHHYIPDHILKTL